MSGFVNLEDAEKKAVRMATNDGLWEILLGLMLLSFTASAVLHDIWGVPWNYIPLILVMVTGIPLMRAAKKSLILPRIGQVEFSQGRKTKFKKVNAFLESCIYDRCCRSLIAHRAKHHAANADD